MSTPNQSNPESDGASKGLVMVVEDRQHDREAMQEVLEQQGYAVITAESGQQALEVLRACPQPPDLIIACIMLPDMNVKELVREVRKESIWMRISFLIMPVLDGGVSFIPWVEYLTKPFSAKDLCLAVEEILKHSRESKGLIMVVEDDLQLLAGLQTVLTQAHYEVITAEDGKQALEALRVCSQPPDLIIMDMWVRGMGGWEIALEIRKQSLGIRVPILFLTGLDGPTSQSLANQFGVADHLTKPFDAEDLFYSVELLRARSRASS